MQQSAPESSLHVTSLASCLDMWLRNEIIINVVCIIIPLSLNNYY